MLFCFSAVSAQYGGYGGYNGYNNGYGRGGSMMNRDRSMMTQGSQPSKPKEVPVEETAARIVEQMKPEVGLDELQAVAITNVLADSMREQGVLLKNENSSQEEKIEQITALSEVTTKKITAFLNPDQVEKYTNFMANFKQTKSKSKKKKDSKEKKNKSETETVITE